MKATRHGLPSFRAALSSLGAATLGLALALSLLIFASASLESRAAPLPMPQLLSPANGSWVTESRVEFSWSNVNGANVYDVRVDGIVSTTEATSMVLELADGSHTWTVQARKNLGNVSGYADEWTVNVDTTPPPIPAPQSPADGAATRNPDVTFSWQNVGAHAYDLRVDEQVYPVPDGATSKTLRLSEGVHSWAVRSRDWLGNVSDYSGERTVAVDTIPPPIPTLQSPAGGAFSALSHVRFSWSAVDGAAAYDLWVDGLVTNTPEISTTLALADGPHNWTVRAKDWAGNASSYAASRMVMVDTALPLVTIAAPASGAVLTTTHLYTLTMRGTASDVGTGLDRVEVNTGVAWKLASETANWTYAWSLPRADNALGALKVRSFDRAGNESAWSQVAVTVDTVAPTCSAPVPDRGPWVSSTVNYDWPPASDASGILLYRFHIASTDGYSRTFDVENSEYSFTEALQEREAYYAWVQALDGLGNWGALSSRSGVIIPDLSPPTVDAPSFLVDSIYLHAVSTTLYYTNAMIVPQGFQVRGYAADAVSGVDRVCFSQAFGDHPSCDVGGFPRWWGSGTPGYAVDPGATASGEIVATVYDEAGHMTRQAFAYELDATPPGSRASSQPYATSLPIRVAWAATDGQSGVGSVDLWYKRGSGGAWTYNTTRSGKEGSFEFYPPGDLSGRYYFVTVARDNLGNPERRATEADTETVYDKGKPTSGVTWAPEYWNRPGVPITITWVATPTSLSPLSEVRLWIRYNEGDWTRTDIISSTESSTAVSGTFSFDPPQQDGRYDFDTVAQDSKGESEAEPYDAGDRTTWYDTDIRPPSSQECIPAGWSRDNAFTLRWENPQDLTGIAAAYYKVGDAPQYLRNGTRVEGADLEQIGRIELPGEGLYTIWLWLEDQTGHVDHTLAVTASCKFDGSIGAPSSLAPIPTAWTKANDFAVTWRNPAELSGIAGAYYKLDSAPTRPEDGTWVPGPDLDRIESITVSTEGSHTLYLWLRDVAGNNGFDSGHWRTVSLLYDPTPPTDVSITAPAIATKTSFMVSWRANAAASGVLRYAVEYSGGMASEWQPLPYTTEASGWFSVPLADAIYDLRLTVYDRAGNSAQAQTRVYVEQQRAYLPVLRSRWRWWYRGDAYEPNDTPLDAYGPLASGQTYPSFIWNEEDLDDYYYIVPASTQQVVIKLTNIPSGNDYDLYVYLPGARDPFRKSNGFGSGNEEIKFTPTPGTRFLIRVHPYKGHNNAQPYHLMVTYR